MASKYWIKLYHEILDDPKMGMLSDNLWRRAIELFLLAGEFDQEGLLPPVSTIAWKLRHDTVTIRDTLVTLSVTNIVTQVGDDVWVVTHFAERQAAISDKERKKRQRERENRPKMADSAEISHDDVTKMSRNVTQITDTDIHVVVEEEARHPDFEKVCSLYQYEIGGLSQTVSDALNDDLDTYPAEWIIEAMKRAALSNNRRYNYVQGILKNWQVIGGPQNDQPKSKHKKGRSTNGTDFNSTHQTSDADPDRIPTVDLADGEQWTPDPIG